MLPALVNRLAAPLRVTRPNDAADCASALGCCVAASPGAVGRSRAEQERTGRVSVGSGALWDAGGWVREFVSAYGAFVAGGKRCVGLVRLCLCAVCCLCLWTELVGACSQGMTRMWRAGADCLVWFLWTKNHVLLGPNYKVARGLIQGPARILNPGSLAQKTRDLPLCQAAPHDW